MVPEIEVEPRGTWEDLDSKPVSLPMHRWQIVLGWDSSSEPDAELVSELSLVDSSACVSGSETCPSSCSLVLSLLRLSSFCRCNLLVKKMLRQPTSSANNATSAETVLQRRRTACSQNSSDPQSWRARKKKNQMKEEYYTKHRSLNFFIPLT